MHCSTNDVMINMQKNSIPFNGVANGLTREFIYIFSYQQLDLQTRLKYLGFLINPNDYGINDWRWLIAKVEKLS